MSHLQPLANNSPTKVLFFCCCSFLLCSAPRSSLTNALCPPPSAAPSPQPRQAPPGFCPMGQGQTLGGWRISCRPSHALPPPQHPGPRTGHSTAPAKPRPGLIWKVLGLGHLGHLFSLPGCSWQLCNPHSCARLAGT